MAYTVMNTMIQTPLPTPAHLFPHPPQYFVPGHHWTLMNRAGVKAVACSGQEEMVTIVALSLEDRVWGGPLAVGTFLEIWGSVWGEQNELNKVHPLKFPPEENSRLH